MALLHTLSQPSRSGPRPAPLLISGVVHAVLLIMVVSSPEVRLPKPQTAYDQSIKGHEEKLLWYHFKNKLPDVKPLVRTQDSRKPRAEVKIAKQSIVSSPKNAPKAEQMIWQPAPELKVEHDVESPNILALALPEIPPPEPVKPKEFVPPQPVERAAVVEPPAELPAAPEVATRAPENRTLNQITELKAPPKPFTPPPPPPQRVPAQTPLLPEAPALASISAQAPAQLSSMAQQNLSANPRVAPRKFVAPAAGARAAGSAIATTLPNATTLPPAPELAARTGARSPASMSLDSAANAINTAIVGLMPSDKLMAPVPKGSRPAEFSAGPELNLNGGAGGASDGARITVPDLMIRGGGNDARPTLVAKAIAPRAPTSPESLRAASKYITVKELGHPSGIRAVNVPDPRFNGRQVYTVAIQMPNITSYVGSWLMWYADRNEVPPNAPPISPPIPHHKVDPKYVATAIEERVEGTIRLACIVDKAGKVIDIELVRGLDDRLNESALEALAKWEFGPAMRAGIPVDVEVLVEIPFRLAPRASR